MTVTSLQDAIVDHMGEVLLAGNIRRRARYIYRKHSWEKPLSAQEAPQIAEKRHQPCAFTDYINPGCSVRTERKSAVFDLQDNERRLCWAFARRTKKIKIRDRVRHSIKGLAFLTPWQKNKKTTTVHSAVRYCGQLRIPRKRQIPSRNSALDTEAWLTRPQTAPCKVHHRPPNLARRRTEQRRPRLQVIFLDLCFVGRDIDANVSCRGLAANKSTTKYYADFFANWALVGRALSLLIFDFRDPIRVVQKTLRF